MKYKKTKIVEILEYNLAFLGKELATLFVLRMLEALYDNGYEVTKRKMK